MRASPGPRRRRTTAEAAALAAELAAWLSSARIPAGPVRTCFRLAEPAADGGPWRVEFALQPADDPSLIVPAADVWAGQGLGGRRGTRWRSCWPGWAPPPGCSASWRTRCARRPRSWSSWTRRGVPVPDGNRAAAGRGRLRRAAARLGAQGAARAEAHHPVPEPRPARRSRGRSSAWVTWLTSGTTWRSAIRCWTRPSWPSWPGSRFRWSGCAASGSSWMSAHVRAALKFLARNQPGAMPAGDALAAGLGGAGAEVAAGRRGRRRLAG